MDVSCSASNQSLADYALAVGTVIAISLLNGVLFFFLAPTNLIMLYLLGVIFVAWRGSRGPAMLAAVLSVLVFDFLFVSPHFSLVVSDYQYVITFGVMLFVSLVISHLTLRLRQQAEGARLRERRTAALYALSRELAGNRGTAELMKSAVRNIAEVFESQVIGLLPDAKGRLVPIASWPENFRVDSKEQGVAQWAYDLGQIAGKGTDTLPASESLYVPMMATGKPIGALGVRPADPQRLLIPDQLHLLETFAHQAGLAVEADRLADQRRQAEAQAEAERLKNVILISIPHDLRTPLAAISGSAASLLEAKTLDEDARRELAQTIIDESGRLSTILNNLLDLTRIESGALQPRKQLVSVEDIIGAALSRLSDRLADRAVNIDIQRDLPFVAIDELLIQQVLLNLLDNALKYSPAGSPIDIAARRDAGELLIEVADRGPGLPEGPSDRLFEKFYRGRQGREGFGLGLAICRGFLKTHGGTIEASNRPEGGASFRFSLPLTNSEHEPKE